MTGSTFAIVMIIIAAVVGLGVMEVLVLLAAERPYFQRAHPDRMQSKVRGGVHLGDPRSLGAPQDEPVRAEPDGHRSRRSTGARERVSPRWGARLTARRFPSLPVARGDCPALAILHPPFRER